MADPPKLPPHGPPDKPSLAPSPRHTLSPSQAAPAHPSPVDPTNHTASLLSPFRTELLEIDEALVMQNRILGRLEQTLHPTDRPLPTPETPNGPSANLRSSRASDVRIPRGADPDTYVPQPTNIPSALASILLDMDTFWSKLKYIEKLLHESDTNVEAISTTLDSINHLRIQRELETLRTHVFNLNIRLDQQQSELRSLNTSVATITSTLPTITSRLTNIILRLPVFPIGASASPTAPSPDPSNTTTAKQTPATTPTTST